jgi:hypothetical protein
MLQKRNKNDLWLLFSANHGVAVQNGAIGKCLVSYKKLMSLRHGIDEVAGMGAPPMLTWHC